MAKETLFASVNNEEKISVLKAVAERPGQSITDLRKTTGVSYSTLHKYLNQLERSGFVSSRPVSDVRLKKVYSPTDLSVSVSARGLVARKPVQNAKLREVLLDAGVSQQLADELSSSSNEGVAQAVLAAKIVEIQKATQALREISTNSVSRALTESEWLREKTAAGAVGVANFTNNFLTLSHELGPVFERGLVLGGKPLTRPPRRVLSALSIAAQLIQKTQGLTAEHVLPDFNFVLAEFSRRARDAELNEALQFFVYQCDATQPTIIELHDSCPPSKRRERVLGNTYAKLEKEAARVNRTLCSLLSDEKKQGKEFKNFTIAWTGKVLPQGLACRVVESAGEGAYTSHGERLPTGWSGLAQVFKLKTREAAEEKRAQRLLADYRREFENQARMSLLGKVRAHCVLRKE